MITAAERRALYRRTTIDAAQPIADALANIPTSTPFPVVFNYHDDSVTAVYSNRVSAELRTVITHAVCDAFRAAGWGFNNQLAPFDPDSPRAVTILSTRLTHPSYLTRIGIPGQEPATLNSALAAFAECMGKRDGIGDIVGPMSCPEAAAIADLLAAVGRTDAADTWRSQHRETDPECTCAPATSTLATA
ncbi:hypothetical protein [Kitasatospora sp. NPDC058478]|uniref:hypothetical protein n=1 Tax=unclassified Kitasatospora TaxID=2633591 RepID=UPI003649E696